MKLYKFLSAISCAALLATAGACTDEIKYTAAPAPTGDQVYFPADAATTVALAQDQTSFDVEILRGENAEAITVPLSATVTLANGTDAPGIFTPATSVSFPAGETAATIAVAVDFAKVEPSTPYIVTINIPEEFTTPYGLSSTSYTVSYAPWTSYQKFSDAPAVGTLSGFGFVNDMMPVYYSRSTIDANMIRFQLGDYGCNDLQPNEKEQIPFVNRKNLVLIKNADNTASMPPMFTNTQVQGSDLYIADVYTFLQEEIPADKMEEAAQDLFEITVDEARQASTYNEKTGLFTIYTVYYAPGVGIALDADEYFQLPGYADYTIEMSKTGSFVNNDGEEQVIINAYKSEDLTSFAYKLVPGALDDETAVAVYAEIEANPENVIDQVQTNISLSLTEEGTYSIAYVGFDGSDPVLTGFYTFQFESVAKTPEWEDWGTALYTDGFLYSVFDDLGGDTWEVPVQKHVSEEGLIRLVNAYSSEYWPQGSTNLDVEGKHYIVLNIADPERVYIETSELGINVNPKYGDLIGTSYAYQALSQGATVAQIDAAGLWGKIDEGYVVFPGASLWLGLPGLKQWVDTNFDPEAPLYEYLYSEDATQEEYDAAIDEQLKTFGWFELDLTAQLGEEPAAARKKVASKRTAPAGTPVLRSTHGKAAKFEKASTCKVFKGQLIDKFELRNI